MGVPVGPRSRSNRGTTLGVRHRQRSQHPSVLACLPTGTPRVRTCHPPRGPISGAGRRGDCVRPPLQPLRIRNREVGAPRTCPLRSRLRFDRPECRPSNRPGCRSAGAEVPGVVRRPYPEGRSPDLRGRPVGADRAPRRDDDHLDAATHEPRAGSRGTRVPVFGRRLSRGAKA